MHSRLVPFLLLLLITLGATSACSTPVEKASDETPIPLEMRRPADPSRIVDLGRGYKEERKSYRKERHRAPPGVDWKAIERANGAVQRERRNERAGFLAAGVGSPWTERGSDNVAGRMHVAARSTDGTMLYGGSSRGGVWRGTLDGQGWTPLGDNLDGGAHWLAIVPGVNGGDPDIIVRGTDDGRIHRSVDQGTTWVKPAGLPNVTSLRRMLVTSDGSHSIFIVVRYTQTLSQTTGIYRSTDRGASFQNVVSLGGFNGDMWAPRVGGGALYLLRNGGNIQRSVNNGDNWTTIGSLPSSGSSGELTGSEAGAPRLWAVLQTGGGRKLYRSDDAGATWIFKQDITDYWGTINASTLDPDLFAWGGVEVHRTADGGDNFAVVNQWWEYYGSEADKLHADIPGMDVVPDPGGGETWYICTDGGLFTSDDGLQSVANISLTGLRVSQYYSTHTSKTAPNQVQAGAQDQGYQVTSSPPTSGTTLSFDQIISGDYGHLTTGGNGGHQYVYSVYPGFILIVNGGVTPNTYTDDFPDNESHPWLPFIVADPDDNKSFFFCAKRLYRYKKASLQNIWPHTQWSSFAFDGSPGEYMTALAFSPLDSNRAYATTNFGRIFWSNDKGVNWTQSATQGPSEVWLYGTSIVPSNVDIDTVYVGGSGYGFPSVWKSIDGGQSFQDHSQGLPDTLVYCLAESPDGQTLMAGSESSVWRRDVGDAAWVDATDNTAPITTYWSAEVVPSQNVIRFGTYGRGIWDYSLDDDCGYEPYGIGLGGTNVLTLDTGSSTQVGQTQTFDVTGGQAFAFGSLIVGIGQVSAPVYGGTILVDPANWILFGMAADATGTVNKALSVPNDPALYDLTIYIQAALPDGSLPGGWAFSNGLQGTLCE